MREKSRKDIILDVFQCGIVDPVADRLDMRRALNELAFRQAGYFTARQARGIGYSAQSQKYHADRGTWVRVERGLYRLAGWPSHESDSYTRWYVWGEHDGVLSHDSAAALHGLGDLDPHSVHLTFAEPRRTRLSGVTLHTAELPATDVTESAPMRLTTPSRTVLDLADSPITQEQFTETVFDALDRALIDPETLVARADDFGLAAALRIERALSDHRQSHT